MHVGNKKGDKAQGGRQAPRTMGEKGPPDRKLTPPQHGGRSGGDSGRQTREFSVNDIGRYGAPGGTETNIGATDEDCGNEQIVLIKLLSCRSWFIRRPRWRCLSGGETMREVAHSTDRGGGSLTTNPRPPDAVTEKGLARSGGLNPSRCSSKTPFD